jgi:hypothetical protein
VKLDIIVSEIKKRGLEMLKAQKIINLIQAEYHYTESQVYAKYPELRKQLIAEELATMKRAARIRRWRYIKK